VQIEWIHAFLAVVDRGGFTAAAVHLYRSQGRISSHIASLERELGAQLFDRDQRSGHGRGTRRRPGRDGLGAGPDPG
jgi:DNA-binding transcriptional LysR family regulator